MKNRTHFSGHLKKDSFQILFLLQHQGKRWVRNQVFDFKIKQAFKKLSRPFPIEIVDNIIVYLFELLLFSFVL